MMSPVALVFLVAMACVCRAVLLTPGGPNYNGQTLATLLGQVTPDPTTLIADGPDDTDFLATPCSVDIHYGTGIEYICHCATSASTPDQFPCNVAAWDGGPLGNGFEGTAGFLVGGVDNGGQVTSGVISDYPEDCIIKDLNVRVKITGNNNSEVQLLFQFRQRTGSTTIEAGTAANGEPLSVKLLAGQEKFAVLPAVDTCRDFRTAAFFSSNTLGTSNSRQNAAVRDIDIAYDDKIGLYCQPLAFVDPAHHGECLAPNNFNVPSNADNGMQRYIDQLADATGGAGVWQTGGASGIPDYCPLNDGQTNQELKYTDEWKDATSTVAANNVYTLLAANTLVIVSGEFRQTGNPTAGTGAGLNVFDGYLLLGNETYSPCYDRIAEPGDFPFNGDGTSPGGFFLSVLDSRDNTKQGLANYLNQWCFDVLCEPIPPPQTTTTPPVITRDPHFVGFHGEKYDFNGRPGEVFNILTDTDVQLNALFVSGERGKMHTFVGEYGLKYNEHRVRIAASGRVFVDDVPLVVGNKQSKYSLDDAGDAYLTTVSKANGNAEITAVLPNYVFKFELVNEINVHEGSVAHIDMQMKLRNNDVRPHGLLGQTALPPSARPVQHGHNDMKEGGDVVEGSYTQYKIEDNSLFGDDFKFNLFGSTRAKRAVDDQQFEISNLTALLK